MRDEAEMHLGALQAGRLQATERNAQKGEARDPLARRVGFHAAEAEKSKRGTRPRRSPLVGRPLLRWKERAASRTAWASRDGVPSSAGSDWGRCQEQGQKCCDFQAGTFRILGVVCARRHPRNVARLQEALSSIHVDKISGVDRIDAPGLPAEASMAAIASSSRKDRVMADENGDRSAIPVPQLAAKEEAPRVTPCHIPRMALRVASRPSFDTQVMCKAKPPPNRRIPIAVVLARTSFSPTNLKRPSKKFLPRGRTSGTPEALNELETEQAKSIEHSNGLLPRFRHYTALPR